MPKIEKLGEAHSMLAEIPECPPTVLQKHSKTFQINPGDKTNDGILYRQVKKNSHRKERSISLKQRKDRKFATATTVIVKGEK